MNAVPGRPLAGQQDDVWGTVDIVAESRLWDDEPAAEATVRRAIAAAAAAAFSGPDGEVSVVLTDDAGIQALNRTWRNIDKPTNVLSFPAQSVPSPVVAGLELGAAETLAHNAIPPLLGDIVIAYETVAREAHGEGKRFADHLAHLTVHGFLHLLGYDHEADDAADEMERLETSILAKLDVPDPYRASAA
jgi:probable rRNA maturation factor